MTTAGGGGSVRILSTAIAGAAAGAALAGSSVLAHVAAGGHAASATATAALVAAVAAAGARVAPRVSSLTLLLVLAAASQVVGHVWLALAAAGPVAEMSRSTGAALVSTAPSAHTAHSASAAHASAAHATATVPAGGLAVPEHATAWPLMLAWHAATFGLLLLVACVLLPALGRLVAAGPRLVRALDPLVVRLRQRLLPAEVRATTAFEAATAVLRRGPPVAAASV